LETLNILRTGGSHSCNHRNNKCKYFEGYISISSRWRKKIAK